MPNRLDNLTVVQNHAVDKGANGRRILLRKAASKPKADDEAGKPGGEGDAEDPKKKAGWAAKAWETIRKAFYGEPSKAITYDQAVERAEARREADKMMSEFWDCHWALREVLESILADDNVTDKRTAIAGALQQFLDDLATKGLVAADDVIKAMGQWNAGSEWIAKAGKKMAGSKRELLDQIKSLVDDLHSWASPAPAAAAADPSGDAPVAKEEPTMAGTPVPTPAAKSETPPAAAPEAISKADHDAQLADLKKSYDAQLADLKKAADDATALAKAERDERLTKAAAQKAKDEMGHLPGIGADELGPILKSLAAGEALTAEQVAKVETVLRASSEAMKASELLKEKGATGSGNGSDAMAKAEGLAKALREADPKLSHAQAMAKAWSDNPDLYKQYQDEKSAAK